MSEFIVSGLNDELVTPMHCFLDALLLGSTIPNTVERLALNIRSQETDQRFQPIEIQLERTSSDSPWQLRFIATFEVVVTGSPQKELSLYFNFAGCWFYHPEIKQCSYNGQKYKPYSPVGLKQSLARSSHTLQSQSTLPPFANLHFPQRGHYESSC
ncbi:DUF2787 family protein [Vibrio alginolyticus]|uniref:DUF2787 family protein n=1 Tax=Vibrio alginolyticus TaxID=663 RepID=UPI003F66CA72